MGDFFPVSPNKMGLEARAVVIPGGSSGGSSSSSSNSNSSGASPTSQHQWGESNCFGGCSTPPGLSSDYSFAETESSEDDDFVAGLAEQMAHSMLDDSDETSEVDNVDRVGLWGESSWNPVPHQPMGSPTEFRKWSAGCWSSGYAINSSSSSKVSSQVSSPPSTPGGAAVDDGWDSAIGADMSSNRFQQVEEFVSPRGSHLPEVQWRHGAAGNGNDSSLCVLAKPYAAAVQRGWTQKEEDRSPLTQCRGSKQAAPTWNRHNRAQPQAPPAAPRSTYRCGVTPRPVGHWPTLPPANGSVMRAVFLGGTADRSSTGTGVFLPRSSNDYAKRKSSCSSVLLPSRIVQVLNLNIDDMRCYPSVQPGTSPPGSGPTLPTGGVDAANLSYPADEEWPPSSSQWKTYTASCSHLHQASESTLPTEWSY
ncbi:uncharacterized protein LOC9644312 [Selaginella moellendorffii]|nr:uncharacterized protein LOC9644312 [Selaginella moellendorffii]|eukprot:XP_002983862.2 uncharacterized protein LOC9644312 [Selaginella moellendorffii]